MPEATLCPSCQPVPGDAEKFYEVVDGQRVESALTDAFETVLATTLSGILALFLKGSRLGRLASETLFQMDPVRDLQRRPDLAYVSYERWPRERRVPSAHAWAVIPDLAIEVISPTNTATDTLTKIRDYFRSGVCLVWVVYPVQELIYVYESPTSVRTLGRGNTLDGGAVLPGFQLPLAELFEQEAEPGEADAQPPAASSE